MTSTDPGFPNDAPQVTVISPDVPPKPLAPSTTTVTVQGTTSSVVTTVPHRDNNTPFLQFVGHLSILTALAGTLRIPEQVMRGLGVFTANAEAIQAAVTAIAVVVASMCPSVTGTPWFKVLKRIFTTTVTKLYSSLIGLACVLAVTLYAVAGCTTARFAPHTHPGNVTVCTDAPAGLSEGGFLRAMVGGDTVRVKPAVVRPTYSVFCDGKGWCEVR